MFYGQLHETVSLSYLETMLCLFRILNLAIWFPEVTSCFANKHLIRNAIACFSFLQKGSINKKYDKYFAYTLSVYVIRAVLLHFINCVYVHIDNVPNFDSNYVTILIQWDGYWYSMCIQPPTQECMYAMACTLWLATIRPSQQLWSWATFAASQLLLGRLLTAYVTEQAHVITAACVHRSGTVSGRHWLLGTCSLELDRGQAASGLHFYFIRFINVSIMMLLMKLSAEKYKKQTNTFNND